MEYQEEMPTFFEVTLNIFLYSVAIFHSDYKIFGKLYYYMYLVMISAATLGSVFPLFLFTDSKHKLEVVCTIIPQITDLCIFLYFHHKRESIYKVINHLYRNNFNALEILTTTEKFFKMKLLTCFVVHSAWASVFIMATVFYVLAGYSISDKYSTMVPFWYSCGDGEIDTIFKHFCWRIDINDELLLANAFLGVCVVLEYAVYCTTLVYYSILMANVWQHINRFKCEMKLMVENIKNNGNDKILNEFCKIIRYQQFLRRYCRDIIDLMYGYVMIFLIEFVFSLIFLLFTIIMEAGKENIIIIKMIILSVSGLAGFILHCFYAQTIADLNEIMLTELANIPWYEQTIKFRKIYAMCLTHNQNSLKVTAAGMYVLNYEFFMNCLKAIYSILNMMLLHYRRR